jgi:signal transduction histidine kinase
MASLGELTAGIAHEIQNPLNFVNNFSELNKELLQELDQEIKDGNVEGAKTITKNVIENEERINFHGKRADSIVKSMLQHSQKSSGQKELTDINALCDEYIRLAYHGFVAKNKSCSASFKTELDPALPAINAGRQDISRAILNLINNAFYAVNEKSKQLLEGYEPGLIISTRRATDGDREGGKKGVAISIKDNGSGIPKAARDKIFQPFFTTKPTGEGTGLGLSLTYDIIKTHGGEISVKSKEGEGSEFIVFLPA